MKHSKADTIKVLNFHKMENREADLTEFDVILCSYNLLASEYGKGSQGKLFSTKWHRVILDEA